MAVRGAALDPLRRLARIVLSPPHHRRRLPPVLKSSGRRPVAARRPTLARKRPHRRVARRERCQQFHVAVADVEQRSSTPCSAIVSRWTRAASRTCRGGRRSPRRGPRRPRRCDRCCDTRGMPTSSTVRVFRLRGRGDPSRADRPCRQPRVRRWAGLRAARRRHARDGAEVAVGPEPSSSSAAAAWEPDRLVVAGGDGTIGPVAELAGRLDVPLAVIGAGTANDFVARLRAAARPARGGGAGGDGHAPAPARARPPERRRAVRERRQRRPGLGRRPAMPCR